MNILHAIETSGPGGAENFMIRTAQSLGPDYHSSILMIKPGWLLDRLIALGFPVYLEPLERTLDPRWLRKVTKYVREGKFDAIHSHEFSMNFHLALIARWLGIPHVATVHGKKQYADRGIRRLAYRLVSRMSMIVAVSQDVKDFLIETVGIKPHRIHVIPNGIEVADYEMNRHERIEVRRALQCAPEDYLICAIGNLYPIKGHKYLIEAMAVLVESHKSIRLVIAGRGGEEAALRRLIKSHGLQGQVELLGFREDVKNILMSADLFVMPSLSEGLPLSLLEAMAARVPVIVSDVGGMPQVIKHSVTGRVVPSGCSLALAQEIEKMIVDRDFASLMADAAYAEVSDNYSIGVMLNRYKRLYLRE